MPIGGDCHRRAEHHINLLEQRAELLLVHGARVVCRHPVAMAEPDAAREFGAEAAIFGGIDAAAARDCSKSCCGQNAAVNDIRSRA
jgi:hypothetical protein